MMMKPARPGGRATPGKSSITRSGSPRVPAVRTSSSGASVRFTTSRGGASMLAVAPNSYSVPLFRAGARR